MISRFRFFCAMGFPEAIKQFRHYALVSCQRKTIIAFGRYEDCGKNLREVTPYLLF
jgi:hypothetical protein